MLWNNLKKLNFCLSQLIYKEIPMAVSRGCFVKYCVGYAVVLALGFSTLGTLEKVLAIEGPVMIGPVQYKVPTYPITADVFTTLEKTVIPTTAPPLGPHATVLPCDIQDYANQGYGEWGDGVKFPYLRPDMQNPPVIVPSLGPDPAAATLLTFFTMSDIHITDKESPAQVPYEGYQYPQPMTPQGPVGNSSAYSAIILSTTHVLDAAVQTINALHQKKPFDFGIGLGDACNNTQFNELRWYIDVLDGQLITPSSGAHLGAGTIGYQKPYQAAGLDKSIPWWQVVGNHDQFWMGSALVNNYIRKTLVGSNVLNMGAVTSLPPNFPELLKERGVYQGVVNGSTEYGEIICAGPEGPIPPPKVAADPRRRSLSIREWMHQFFHTTSKPVGHGFTRQMVGEGFACYHFYPKADIPIKVIVLDDTDKAGTAKGALDQKRFQWLKNELHEGQTAGELMIICAHIPVNAYGQQQPQPGQPYGVLPIWITNPAVDENVSLQDLLDTLHSYPNLVLWLSGHVHRNTITPQPQGDPANGIGFWEVETPSLRDYPQQFRRFEIVRNPNQTISIFALNVDTAVNPAIAENGSLSPAWTSRSYALAAQQIFGNPWRQGPGMVPSDPDDPDDPSSSCVYNAELVIQMSQISPQLQDKINNIKPVVSSFKINGNAASTKSQTVTLNNTVVGSTPTGYLASEDPGFSGAVWLPYSKAPSFTLSPNTGVKTVYFKVQDGSGTESAVVHSSIRYKAQLL
jgi:metallophosphoesterase (TIGR03768 family)